MTPTEKLITNTFSDSWHGWFRTSGVELVDVSREVGIFDRVAYEGTQAQWDRVHALMTEFGGTLSGRERGRVTRALGRITTSEAIARREAERAERIAARKALKAAPKSRTMADLRRPATEESSHWCPCCEASYSQRAGESWAQAVDRHDIEAFREHVARGMPTEPSLESMDSSEADEYA